jgi:hypothetical protein
VIKWRLPLLLVLEDFAFLSFIGAENEVASVEFGGSIF